MKGMALTLSRLPSQEPLNLTMNLTLMKNENNFKEDKNNDSEKGNFQIRIRLSLAHYSPIRKLSKVTYYSLPAPFLKYN